MKKKKVIALLLAMSMVSQGAMAIYAGESSKAEDVLMQTFEVGTQSNSAVLIQEEKVINGINDRFTAPPECLASIKNLGSAAVTVTFKTTNTDIQALAAVNSTSHTNDYIALYISGGNRIGVELRNNQKNDHQSVDINGKNLADGNWHTVTFVIDENKGYKFYADKELVKEIAVNETTFTKNIGWEPASVTFGGANRISGNSYPFSGSIKTAKVYYGAATPEEIMADHGVVAVPEQILAYPNHKFDGTEAGMVALNDVAKIAELTQGTFSFAYKLDPASVNSNIAGLLSISNKDDAGQYGAIYLKPSAGKIGFEVQGKGDKSIEVPGKLNNSSWHTVTIANNGTSADVYFDGESVGNIPNLSWVLKGDWTPNAMTLGGIQRNNALNTKWPFKGEIDGVRVYNYALDAQQAMQVHTEMLPEDVPVIEENVFKTQQYGLFDMGDNDAFNYRIPALVTTKNGVIIAAADQRHTHWSDWGNVDTVIKRSSDMGQTWTGVEKVLDPKTQPYFSGVESAFMIDPVMIASDSGRVWMLVDMFPEAVGSGQGIHSATKPGTGFVTAEDGNKYLALYDKDNTLYTLRGHDVYDASGKKTAYTVDGGSTTDGYHKNGDLYENGNYLGNIYLRSENKGNDSAPLHPFQTTYLWLTHSDDDGATWSEPVNISGQIKEDWMRFCGTGPGFGIELKNGEHKGRLIFPIYYTTGNQGIGFQSSACVYSDDNGQTWHRGESPNDGRINNSGQPSSSQNPQGISELTESQIIELNNGHLLQFMRNTSGKVMVAKSVDGGETWDDPQQTNATDVYCQLSVLHYPELVNGKECIVMSNPGGGGRNNGTLRIGEVGADDSITWTDTKMFRPGNYAYSCLTYMGDNKLGLLYEHQNTIKFTSFNLDFIRSKAEITQNPAIVSANSTVEKASEHEGIRVGDKLTFTVVTDQKVNVAGKPQFRFMMDGKGKFADYVSQAADGKTLTFEYVVKENDEGSMNFRGPKIISEGENSVKNSQGMDVTAGDMVVDFGSVDGPAADDSRDIPVTSEMVSDGTHHSGEGADKALDNNTGTLWHTEWGSGHNRKDHWIAFDLGKEYMVDGVRYLPRLDNAQNGVITGYKMQVSDDGKTYKDVFEGTWDAKRKWKQGSFEPVKTRYVRFVVTDALSGEKDNDYASAAEIRLTGTEVSQVTPTPTEEVKPTPTEEVKPTPTEEIKPTPTEEVKPTPTEEVKPTPTEEVKPTPTEEVKPTPTEEVKPTPTEEVKPTPTEEVKPTPTEEVKPTPTEEVKPTPTEKDEKYLAEKIKEAEKVDLSVYTDASSAALRKAVTAAKATLAKFQDGTVTKEEYDIVTSDLKDAMDGLKKKETTPIVTVTPTAKPTMEPTVKPTVQPTAKPTMDPTVKPTVQPTAKPTMEPTVKPTVQPTVKPTTQPIVRPTVVPVNPSRPVQPAKPGNGVHTGDMSPIAGYGTTLLAAAALAGTALKKKRFDKRNDKK